MKNLILSASAAIALIAIGQSSAIAEDVKWTSCWAGTSDAVVRGEGDLSFSLQFRGTTITENPDDPFNMTSFKCVGSGEFSGGKSTGVGYCQAVDGDGDKVFSSYDVENGVGPLTYSGGTGKFEGISGVIEIKSVGQFPSDPGEFVGCNKGNGSYTLG